MSDELARREALYNDLYMHANELFLLPEQFWDTHPGNVQEFVDELEKWDKEYRRLAAEMVAHCRGN